MFVVLTMDAFRARPEKGTLVLAVGCAVLAMLVAPGSMLLVAMTLFSASLIARESIDRELIRA